MEQKFIETQKDSSIPKIYRMPVSIEEVGILMAAEGMTEFKSKVIFLQAALREGQIHNIKFNSKEYQKLFIDYLTQEKQKEME